jgi:hypothetical protein
MVELKSAAKTYLRSTSVATFDQHSRAAISTGPSLYSSHLTTGVYLCMLLAESVSEGGIFGTGALYGIIVQNHFVNTG